MTSPRKNRRKCLAGSNAEKGFNRVRAYLVNLFTLDRQTACPPITLVRVILAESWGESPTTEAEGLGSEKMETALRHFQDDLLQKGQDSGITGGHGPRVF